MLTLKKLQEKGYRYRESIGQRQAGVLKHYQIWSRQQELSGKPWQGAYGLERRGLIHRAVVRQGGHIELASYHAIQKLTDGTWWYCANVPPVLQY